MKKFLEYVAQDIIQRYGTDLSRIAVVFPNKRASLFLNKYLARLAGKPIWSPKYITISELFRQHSQLTVGDPLKLTCELYNSYLQQTGFDETLDHFFSWGQLLIADFDDIDKNMADADKVFENVVDIHQYDNTDYLSEEQKETLRQFFKNFIDIHDESELKQRFLNLWVHLASIYHDFQNRLSQQGIAYEGMLYRSVAQDDSQTYEYDHYLFVGFNVLQTVERTLFRKLKDAGKAVFYWDYDEYYIKNDNIEAGFFLKQYLNEFPNALSEQALYRHFNDDKDITFISSTTEDAQARFIPQWLHAHDRIKDGVDTAIVMCDENLLQSVIHSLPDELGTVNITTGYPLINMPVCSLVMNLLTLHHQGMVKKYQLRRLERHPYYPLISQELLLEEAPLDNKTTVRWIQQIIKQIGTQQINDPLAAESLFSVYTLLNRLYDLMNDGLTVDSVTMQRLIQQLFQSTSIPFHGEPAEGVQVMGVLETRNLDFKHVILLSCNEGNLPKSVNDASFIPHSIRKAYGLTTVEHKVAVFSYYFHRLLQRAEDITILYNNSTDGGQRGEMSRFMLQLLVESSHAISKQTLIPSHKLPHRDAESIKKDQDIIKRLEEMRLHRISPTAINHYLRCPLVFYYNDVKGIKEDDPLDDEIDNRIFGNIFHKAAEMLYNKMKDRTGYIKKDQLAEMSKHPEEIERVTDMAFCKEYFKTREMPELNGIEMIKRAVIIRYLKRLLSIDQRLAPFRIVGNELRVNGEVKVNRSCGALPIKISGIIDRLDEVTDPISQEKRIRVVDYKTGGSQFRNDMKDVEGVFDHSKKDQHADYYLQTMLYASLVRKDKEYNPEQLPVSPSLLFIQHSAAENYDPTLCINKEKIADIQDYMTPFIEGIERIFAEIYDPEQDFHPTDNRDNCEYCPYKHLCGMS